MQDRYVGDIGDYTKLALLRALAPGRRLGVAWYLTPDETHNGDGRHVGYLQDPAKWRSLDPELFDYLSSIVASGRRSIGALEEGVLGHAAFHNRRLEGPAMRTNWFGGLVASTSGCNLVFLDPDNGLEPAGYRAGSAKSIKSATYAEIGRLRAPGRALVVYHHQTRMKGGHDHEILHLAGRLRELGADSVCAVRARPFSPRVFFLIDADATLVGRARSFATRWGDLVLFHESATPSATTG